MSKSDPAVSVVKRIDALCDRYEAAWKSEQRPDLAGYLDSCEVEMRPAAFAALLAVEIELRTRAGKHSTPEEYRGRFPDLAKVVDRVFDEWHKRPAATVDTSVSGESVRSGSRAGMAAKASPTALSKKIGRFEVQELLGEGGFGKVYKARDPKLDRDVAIKLPRRGILDTSDEAQRFLREARAAANLHHPNLCPVHEVGEVDGGYYIVMAYVDGKSLDATLKERTTALPAKQAALIMRKLALALSAAHAKGIIHRDLKPSNIMIDRERKDVVIMDFGLARRRKQGDAKLTQEGAILGTPAYMAPEQARGDGKAIGPASDIYGLGVILYEMLAGKVPFSGSVNEVLGKVLHVEPAPPSTQRAGVDSQLEAICMKAIAKAPAERFASMKALADALDGFLKGMSAAEPVKPTKGSGLESGQLTKVAQALSAERREETRAAIEEAVRRTRIPLWQWLAGAGFLATVIVAGIIFFARTPTATVLISIEGLDIKDCTLAFFLDKKNISGDDLQRPIELKVGDHELVVMRGQEEVRRYRFVVRGGPEPGIQVTETRPGPGEGKVIHNTLGMKLVLIPAGKFLMGSPENEADRHADEGPQHEVAIPKPFHMGAHEVTVGQFRAFVQAKDYKTEAEKDGTGARNVYKGEAPDPNCNWLNPGKKQTEAHPVTCVSWNDAAAFCRWLSAKENKNYRLPTEAEWEYACRAGTTTTFHTGPSLSSKQANFQGEGAKELESIAVGSYPPNAFGLHDMHGNVWELCGDWYAADYATRSMSKDPWAPATGTAKVLRGGSWYDAANWCRSAYRGTGGGMWTQPPTSRYNHFGFRVVYEPGKRADDNDVGFVPLFNGKNLTVRKSVGNAPHAQW